MKHTSETLKGKLRLRKRRGISGMLVTLILLAFSVVAGVVVITQFTDLADTASVVDAIEITEPVIYAEQGYVSVKVKNSGNTALEITDAEVLVENAAVIAADDVYTDCGAGTQGALFGPGVDLDAATLAMTDVSLTPGESVTISGGLPCDDGNEIDERAEYILEVTGTSNGQSISKTISIIAR